LCLPSVASTCGCAPQVTTFTAKLRQRTWVHQLEAPIPTLLPEEIALASYYDLRLWL
jgi:hypothetical protein